MSSYTGMILCSKESPHILMQTIGEAVQQQHAKQVLRLLGSASHDAHEFRLSRDVRYREHNVRICFVRPVFERAPIARALAAYRVGVLGATINLQPVQKLAPWL